MKQFVIAILCGLILTVAIGWAAESIDRYKDRLLELKRIQSLESKVATMEDQVKDLERGLRMLELRVEEMAIELRRISQDHSGDPLALDVFAIDGDERKS